MDDDSFQKILFERKINNNNNLRRKFLKDHIFQDLTLEKNSKYDNIEMKINKINNEQLNDLKLIDIRFIRKFLSYKDINSSVSSPSNKTYTFSNTLNNKCLINKKNKKEIKLFPYLSLNQTSKYKSRDKNILTENNYNNIKNENKFININEKKLFVTKIENGKKWKNNFYPSNLFLNNTYKNNENKYKIFYNKNPEKKRKIMNLVLSNASENYEKTKSENNILNYEKVKKPSKYKSYSEINRINNNDKSCKEIDIDKEDYLIYKLLKKK